MQFEMGYYVNSKGEIFYFNCLAIDSETQRERVVFMDSNRVHWTESKSVWMEQFRRCENQLNACQQFQSSKSLSYDEWLLIGSEPESSKTFENEDIYDNDGNMLCIYCFSKLPKGHSVTVCDACYEAKELL